MRFFPRLKSFHSPHLGYLGENKESNNENGYKSLGKQENKNNVGETLSENMMRY